MHVEYETTINAPSNARASTRQKTSQVHQKHRYEKPSFSSSMARASGPRMGGCSCYKPRSTSSRTSRRRLQTTSQHTSRLSRDNIISHHHIIIPPLHPKHIICHHHLVFHHLRHDHRRTGTASVGGDHNKMSCSDTLGLARTCSYVRISVFCLSGVEVDTNHTGGVHRGLVLPRGCCSYAARAGSHMLASDGRARAIYR